MPWPPVTPVFPAGKEPLPPGMTEEDRAQIMQAKKYQDMMSSVPESCLFKTGMAGVAGFGLGAFFSLMSSSFAYEDPLLRPQSQSALNTTQKAREIFKDMGKGMWRSGKGFGKVGALFAGLECVIESYRARNDIVNPTLAGFIAGGILARNSGPKAVLGGGAAFAAFSAAIDLFLKRESSE
ncbi:Tim17-domain-containing protein [Fomitiporia mediterranea MF3/22]|uniref:Tim17-domain-containing protein n=1 Tax=Fomitiporia mediterranea (strain MF3/22) TaxID=694068 RepID=UPI00044097A4|nr:Tim17-domain-containing protein [Fomitiporia mediterranea MF3/22]EJD07964.1 Tim17-domain-containing protein [Fomitiporia mediterranea MF3/22]